MTPTGKVSRNKSSVSTPDDGKSRTQTMGKTEGSEQKEQCVIVGVGASAGGLEAFTQLLRALPKEPGMAFVLIPHLDPKHESVMSDLLGRTTDMDTRQVYEGMRVKPNCVYVIPPNKTMTIHDGMLQLDHREDAGHPPMPIDVFLRSLALDCGKNAIGVILSGTASDGTAGVAVIKNEGGITFAQEPASAKYDGMPNHAIASGHIDFILKPEEIARELMRIRDHSYVNGHGLGNEEQPDLQRGNEIDQIFRLLRQVRKVDFSEYKPATIRRRIHRRMALSRLENLQEYLEYLRQNPREIEALHNDILINVTSFFRDQEAFEALKETVYPEILRGRGPNDTVRIWVPGCSTGEEAYSHAISLVEHVSKSRTDVSIQIFGTDLSDDAIRIARYGAYKESIAADVSPTRLRRFFTRVEGGYQISKAIRDMCVFATQNVFNDPPFSRMDLVSCRNVLIYLSPVLQKRVIPIFHYALRPTGFLMVGNTEGIVGAGADLFEAADKRQKIYRKRLVSSPVSFGVPREYFDGKITPVPVRDVIPPDNEPLRTPIELQREADRLLIMRYVPAAVLVNEQYDILQIRGRANRYLELPSGKATLNLFKMAKPGMLFELQKALEDARNSGQPVRRENVQYEVENGFSTVTVETIPVHSPSQSQTSYIVVFEESADGGVVEAPPKPAVPEDAKDRQIAQLKQELGATKEYLQSIIEALEASNEELQSANEEIQSGNEELQSTNEELQTSKEELESANEELNTVNEEMQHRNIELTQLNNDLVNLLASVNIPIVMLDADLNIRRVTPQVEDALGITPNDLGRPLRHIRLKINVPEVERLMLNVIDELQPKELQIADGQNHTYRMRITPYRTMENRIEGVVLVMLAESGAKVRVNEKRARAGSKKSRK